MTSWWKCRGGCGESGLGRMNCRCVGMKKPKLKKAMIMR